MGEKHTPGPWKCVYGNAAREFNEISIRPVQSPIKGLVLPIASVSHPEYEFGQANARLIAAAPELLDLLDRVVKAFDSYDNCDEIEFTSDLRNEARAAIAKATNAQK